VLGQIHSPQNRIKDIAEVDVIRCRRNALAYSAHPFPLFCALDTIQPFDKPGLHDLQWIDAGPYRNIFDLPDTGPRWYLRVAAEFTLHHAKV
jgi:hypothetical protein